MSVTIQHLLLAMANERQRIKTNEGNLTKFPPSRLICHALLDDDYVHIQQTNSQWPKLFDVYFLSPKTRLTQTCTNGTSDDDLIFYVTRQMDNDFQHPLVRVLRYFSLRQSALFSSIWWKSFAIMTPNGNRNS